MLLLHIVGRSGSREIPDSGCQVKYPAAAMILSPADRRILDFERGWFLHPEPKDRSITDVLGLTPAEYYDRLRDLMTTQAALSYDPLTIRRLRRMVGAA